MYALIDDRGLIAQVAPEPFSVELPSRWVECPEGCVAYAWTFDGGVFSAPVLPVPTQEQIADALEYAVQHHLDATAKARGYDNIVSACSYAAAPNPFQAEGIAFITWRGAVWARCYAIMADVQAGNLSVPTADALIADLPKFVLA